ncbi:MAG: type II toxin-antitoxin system RatA family toxin [Brevundimonas sp.]|uniref:type II toxin-antitoxin system RatA family toxin n=1 Tax=Brevundimonas sp. TaxID=1871086 RepID=UPI00120DA79F|nr:type II toxin-antitoxin system RatA family toxin [Brevundimonas sp.]RZJ19262.1 MAG: type II toxin-antitoxin system RatA family toxin [Brevundimonas sp.]
MAVHRLTRVLPYAPEQLADMVANVRDYPLFVPWITSMRAWNEREEAPGVTMLDAEAGVGFAFLNERFSTWVRHDRNAPTVEVGLIRGPFKHLKNRWEFHPDPGGTRLEFFIDFAFKSRMLDAMLHANFDRAVRALIHCFETRAEGLYGRR